jgi:CheY-like chemotaxis protein
MTCSPGAAPEAPSAFERPLDILLVEDNPVNRRLAQHALEKAGHSVVTADSGLAALAALEHAHFDLVLMDVQMPGLDGLEATAKIREREKTSGGRVAVVALTAHAMPGDRARCLGAGMDDYLTKPIQPAALLEAIRRLRLNPGERCASEPAGKATLDRVALMDRVGGDARLLAEISGTFLDACSQLMPRAREAMHSGDAERFACEVHTLRGMFRSLSGIAAEDETRKLEELDPRGSIAGKAIRSPWRKYRCSRASFQLGSRDSCGWKWRTRHGQKPRRTLLLNAQRRVVRVQG